MEEVREQQERLARLHFDLNNQQDIFGHDSDEGRIIAKNNMSKLIENVSIYLIIEHLININYF